MRPKRRIYYSIFAADGSLSFRDNTGNLHRGFDVDPSSAGCVWRSRPKGALRVARRIAEQTGKAMTIELIIRRSRHGERRSSWAWRQWTVEPERYVITLEGQKS